MSRLRIRADDLDAPAIEVDGKSVPERHASFYELRHEAGGPPEFHITYGITGVDIEADVKVFVHLQGIVGEDVTLAAVREFVGGLGYDLLARDASATVNAGGGA